MFAREGIEVEVRDLTTGGAGIVGAVEAGEVDCAEVSVTHFLNTLQTSGPVDARFAFMIERRSHMAAIVVEGRPTAAGRVVRELADLAGATVVGSRSSQFTRELLAVLHRLGIEPGPVVETPYREVMDALAAGRGDVAADWIDLVPDFARRAEAYHLSPVGFPLADAGLPPQYSSGFLFSGRVLRRSPGDVARVCRALREAMVRARRDPATGLERLLRTYPNVDRDLALAQWRAGEQVMFADGEDALGSMDPETWAATVAFHLEAHGGPALDPSDAYHPAFLTKPGTRAPAT